MHEPLCSDSKGSEASGCPSQEASKASISAAPSEVQAFSPLRGRNHLKRETVVSNAATAGSGAESELGSAYTSDGAATDKTAQKDSKWSFIGK